MSKRILCGTIISTKSNKTIVVSVLNVVKHKLYKKVVKRYRKYNVHNPYIDGSCDVYKEGSLIKIQECKPISSTKRWVIFNEGI